MDVKPMEEIGCALKCSRIFLDSAINFDLKFGLTDEIRRYAKMISRDMQYVVQLVDQLDNRELSYNEFMEARDGISETDEA